jgi:hypothetical protein
VSEQDRRNPRERGSAAGIVALLLLALALALGAYIAWGLLLTPHLVGVRPNPAAEKSAVVLQGSRFAPFPGGNIVLFGDQTGKVLRAGANELEVVVPELGLPEGRQARVPVRVLVEGRVSESVELTIGVAPAPPPPPVAEATPEATPEPSPAPEAASPEPSATPARPRGAEARPSPSPSAAAVGGALLADADAAAAAGDFAKAADLYARALEREPESARARAGRETAQAAAASLARSFVLGKTQVEGAATRSDMKAFDTRDVSVRKPPEVLGRLEIEAQPARVKPGDAVKLGVFLVNEGTKAIKIAAMNVATLADSVRSSGPVTPAVKEVPAQKRVLLAEVAHTWKPAKVWRLEVQVTSDRGETYANVLSWK